MVWGAGVMIVTGVMLWGNNLMLALFPKLWLEPARGFVLAQEQIGDEVATQGKKYAYPEHSARSPVQAQVICDNGQYGEGPQPIKSRQISLTAMNWLWHLFPPCRLRRYYAAFPLSRMQAACPDITCPGYGVRGVTRGYLI